MGIKNFRVGYQTTSLYLGFGFHVNFGCCWMFWSLWVLLGVVL
jgi:hypothetical protein